MEGHQLIDLIFKDSSQGYVAVEVKTGKAEPKSTQRRILAMLSDLGAQTFLATYDVEGDKLEMSRFPARRHVYTD